MRWNDVDDKLKDGDRVEVIYGIHIGKTGTIVELYPRYGRVRMNDDGLIYRIPLLMLRQMAGGGSE